MCARAHVKTWPPFSRPQRLNEALDKIIEEVKERFKGQQNLIDNQVEMLSNCSQIPKVNVEAKQREQKLIDSLSTEEEDVKTHAKGKIKYNFGKDKTTSSIEADRQKSTVDKYKELFDSAFQDLSLSEQSYKLQQEELERLNQEALEKNQVCQCVAKKGYNGYFPLAMDATKKTDVAPR